LKGIVSFILHAMQTMHNVPTTSTFTHGTRLAVHWSEVDR